MAHFLGFFDRLLATFPDHCPDHSKCLNELAMALHYARRDYPAGLLDAGAMVRLEDEIDSRIHQDGWLRMIQNEFVLHQCATPYIFARDSLRARGRGSVVHEGLIADMAAHDRMLGEATPYRRLERDWLLAKLGFGALPDWRDAPVLRDARRCYGFDRMLAYAFTHVVFFTSDFGALSIEDPLIKGVSLMLAAQAFERDDVDLFWECAICAITQPLTSAELSGLLHLLAVTREKHGFLFDPRLDGDGLREAYHPLLVHDILRGMMLARHGIDITTHAPGEGPGCLGAILRLANALGHKDPGKITAALAECPQEDWLLRMAHDRLQTLSDLAGRGILFARECAVMGLPAPEPGLHAEFAAQIAPVIAGLKDRIAA